MSSYSFSPQFSKHWTGAPKPVRAAIVQELTDITDLLQTDTPFEDFVFSVHDLDAHLDELYDAHQIEQDKLQRLEAEQAKEKEQQEIEQKKQQAQEKRAQEKAEAERQAAQAQTHDSLAGAADQDNIMTSKKSDDDHNDAKATAIDDKDNDETYNKLHQNAESENAPIDSAAKSESDPETTDAAIDLSQDVTLSAAHENLIQELEATVDDYLTEQMLQMSENLKSWLRAEVSRQLTKSESAADPHTIDHQAPTQPSHHHTNHTQADDD